MRILFASSAPIAIPSLRTLVFEGEGEVSPSSVQRSWTVVGVLTNPDSPRGRGGGVSPTEIAFATEEINQQLLRQGRAPIPILKFEKLDRASRETVAILSPDLLVSFAYGKIFGPKFLSLFPLGGINIHPSLLPRYRGPTPIPAAILHRDRETGITIQRIALEMDAGDILLQESFPLGGRETTESVSTYVAERAPGLLVQVLQDMLTGTLHGVPQDNSQATYCHLIKKEDGKIDWSSSAWDIDARIRAYTPWPLCYTLHKNQLLYVLEAEPLETEEGSVYPNKNEEKAGAGFVVGVDKRRGILVQTGEGLLAVRRLQYATKKALDWKSFLNGARDVVGSRLGDN
ncbi:MAG: methionyl-tRNA formyltransferase [Treponemataceae bacterium]|nr:methionyl-tRNA formyltransferase [Treponemataceae bacterium]